MTSVPAMHATPQHSAAALQQCIYSHVIVTLLHCYFVVTGVAQLHVWPAQAAAEDPAQVHNSTPAGDLQVRVFHIYVIFVCIVFDQLVAFLARYQK
jgi:hypothetical protein